MARYDITQVNGITKEDIGIGFIYHFPLEIIVTHTVNNDMRRTQRGQSDYEYVRFDTIIDNLSTVDIEGYVDALCTGNYYRDSNEEPETITDITLTESELLSTTALANIENKLDQMIFLLKNIAE